MFAPSLPVKAALIEHVGRCDVKPGTFIPLDNLLVTFVHAYTGEEFIVYTDRIVGLVVAPDSEQAAEDRKAA